MKVVLAAVMDVAFVAIRSELNCTFQIVVPYIVEVPFANVNRLRSINNVREGAPTGSVNNNFDSVPIALNEAREVAAPI